MSDLKLSDEELKVLAELHKKAQELMFQLGQLDLRMDDIRLQVRELNHRAQVQMNDAAKRLGIAAGTPWQCLPDGTVVILPTDAPQP